MQAAETVYEVGSSPDEDDDNPGQSSANNSKKTTSHHLRPNKSSSTNINQKLSTNFSSVSDNRQSSQSPSNINNFPTHHDHRTSTTGSGGGREHSISVSDDQISLNTSELNTVRQGSTDLAEAGSISNASNTSLSSTTNSSRGNISQAANQSVNLSQKNVGQQPSSSSQQNPNFDSNVISERVKNLATQIYQELKRIISRCNYDEDILSGLMPLIVRVLESLDLALIESQQLQVELELCKDDNEQLVVMFEKEKAAKRAIDKKLIESEYAYEEERQQYQQKIESLDNIVKMFELKAKNASDQAARFEEKEAERKKDYNKLHDRYTELLKSHCEVVERFRHLVGNAESAQLTSINVTQQSTASSSDLIIGELHHLSKNKFSKSDESDLERSTSLRNRDVLKSWNPETELTLEDASLVVIEDILEPANKGGESSSHNESDRGASEPEGEHEKESENDSIAYTSMEKEFRKLIQENKDLLNTKNALNVVKDDLIADVDRLNNEVAMYEQAVEQLNSTKDQMKQKVSLLDTELRRTKEELNKAKQMIREYSEEGDPSSQQRKFKRSEMAKVLMERNNYKERFMELQDAVRYTELVRANKVETEKRSGLWKFFSNLFGAPPRELLAIGPAGQTVLTGSRNPSPVVSYHGSAAVAAAITSPDARSLSSGRQLVTTDALHSVGNRGSSILSTNQRLSTNSDMIVLMDSDLNVDRMRAFKDSAIGSPRGSDSSGYIHAYGWSLPASALKPAGGRNIYPDPTGSAPRISSIMGGTSSYAASDGFVVSQNDNSFGKLTGLRVPIPQYCRPLSGDSIGMKIWCATTIDLSGGEISDQEQSTQSKVQGVNSSTSILNISRTSDPSQSSTSRSIRILEHEVTQALGDNQSRGAPDTLSTESPSTSRKYILKANPDVVSALPVTNDLEELSSCVWICSTQHSRSKITIIDIKTRPNEMLDSFYIPTFLYCVTSIPGAKSNDLLGITKSEVSDEQKTSLTLSMIQDMIKNQRKIFYQFIEVDSDADQDLRQKLAKRKQSTCNDDEAVMKTNLKTELDNSMGESSKVITNQLCEEDADAEISRILDNDTSVGIATLHKINDFMAHTQPQQHKPSNDSQSNKTHTVGAYKGKEVTEESKKATVTEGQDVGYYQPISTCLSTVWMGGRDSVLYIHSAIGQWKDCVAYIKLRDSILQICHYRARVFVALADGFLCVFFRNITSKQWEFSQYLLIDINLMAGATNDPEDLSSDLKSQLSFSDAITSTPIKRQSESVQDVSLSQMSKTDLSSNSHTKTTINTQNKVAGIRCLEIANKNLWVGYKNRILIIDPITLKLRHILNVVPQTDNQIRQLISMKDGIFCCLRSDLILRLYSSLKPYQHIQNIDIEPVVTRLISPKTFVISHITAMKVVGETLWIGNAHGIILTVPCNLVPQVSENPVGNQQEELEESSNILSIARFIPKCDIANAQTSFHGHKDAVKFFISAHNLMLSGGQGYLDLRLDMDDQSRSISDKSHIILWQLPK